MSCQKPCRAYSEYVRPAVSSTWAWPPKSTVACTRTNTRNKRSRRTRGNVHSQRVSLDMAGSDVRGSGRRSASARPTAPISTPRKTTVRPGADASEGSGKEPPSSAKAASALQNNAPKGTTSNEPSSAPRAAGIQRAPPDGSSGGASTSARTGATVAPRVTPETATVASRHAATRSIATIHGPSSQAGMHASARASPPKTRTRADRRADRATASATIAATSGTPIPGREYGNTAAASTAARSASHLIAAGRRRCGSPGASRGRP
jgi:hypothetical protein